MSMNSYENHRLTQRSRRYKMPKKVRSARGEIVDFDLMKVKQQIEAAPEPSTVQARQDFIDQKMRRRLKKVKRKLDSVPKRRTGPDGNPIVEVDKKVAAQSAPEGEKIDVVEEEKVTKKTAPKKTSKKKRKIKRKTTKKEA